MGRAMVLMIFFAACSDAASNHFDARPVDAWPGGELECFDGCNPIANTGCTSGERCTMVNQPPGDPCASGIGCALDGTIPLGGACTPSTALGPHDACAGTSICYEGTCAQVCDLQRAGDCGPDRACRTAPDYFSDSGVALAGVCVPTCDPLTQALSTDGAAACGSSDPAQPDRGCYSLYLDAFTCAPAGDLANTDRVALTGSVYVNTCAPGYLALFYESAGSMTVVCSGLCAPHDADATQPAYAAGDPLALAKLPHDPAPVQGHGTCAVGAKGAEPGEDCRYLWTLLFDSAGDPIASPYADTLGGCIATSHYGMPSCATLAPADAIAQGCHASGAHLAGPRVVVPTVAALHRHAIEAP